jgi:hypothetical protein
MGMRIVLFYHLLLAHPPPRIAVPSSFLSLSIALSQVEEQCPLTAMTTKKSQQMPEPTPKSTQ